MKKKIIILSVITLLFSSYFFMKMIFSYYKEVVKNDIVDEIGLLINYDDNKNSLFSYTGISGNNPIGNYYNTKSELVKDYPNLKEFFEQYPDISLDELESDWVAIQNSVYEASINSDVLIPVSENGYRINRPIKIRQGQTLKFSSNTRVYDDSEEYAFEIIGGDEFPGQALTHITLGNIDIVGNPKSKGAIKINNAYMINIDNVKISGYKNQNAKALFLQDFFQVSLNSVQINDVENGIGLFIDSIKGNSGQLNLMNTIIQRSRVGLFVEGSSNLIDGVNMYGGAVGNNYKTGVQIGKNVNNVNFIGSHFENHDGVIYPGTTAVNMNITDGGRSESINFIGNLFVNNKYSIISDNTSRVSITGNQFDGRNLPQSIAIQQGEGDSFWSLNPNQFINNDQNLHEAGENHINLSSISIDQSGAIFPQQSNAAIYSGSKDPNGHVEADEGSIYMRTNGEASSLYIKKGVGKSGWVSIED